jgi:hypothetical protein
MFLQKYWLKRYRMIQEAVEAVAATMLNLTIIAAVQGVVAIIILGAGEVAVVGAEELLVAAPTSIKV